MRYGVSKSGEEERMTTLLEKLKEGFIDLSSNHQLLEQDCSEPEQSLPEQNDEWTYEQRLFATDPMIGMENVTPYDFMTSG